jgi:hypothetical protein
VALPAFDKHGQQYEWCPGRLLRARIFEPFQKPDREEQDVHTLFFLNYTRLAKKL